MSHSTLHQSIDVTSEEGIGYHPYPPQPALAQAPQGVSNFADGSGTIFSMYLEMAAEEDKKMVDNWKADADGILIFTGLFSAAVASLISVSIQDIRQDPQDTSNFYLANIYQTLADPTRSNISSSLPSSPPPFSPPNYAIWVNALWFLSLVISLTCALLATLLQQWARRYLKVTQPRYALHKRARIRAFLAEGVEKFLLPWTVETLPTLLHISLFLFFAGLVVFLWNVSLTIFKLVLSSVGICTALYGCITVMPIFHHDSPYHTPLSLPTWHIITGILFLTFRTLRRLTVLGCFSWETYVLFRDLAERYGRWPMQGMQKTVEETALSSPSEIDARAFLWTFDSLDEDHELERFFSGLLDFRSSKVVEDPLPKLAEGEKQRLFTALAKLLDRTLLSDLLPAPVKFRRIATCMELVNPTYTTNAINTDERAKATFSKIIARVWQRDDPWFILASKSLDITEDVLRGYAAHGDSLSLAILVHVTRQQLSFNSTISISRYVRFSEVLLQASKFNVRDTIPELQQEFCALWNQIVRKTQNEVGSELLVFYTLGRIRNIYLALHQGTDCAPTQFSASTGDEDHILYQPSSYPLCNIPGHHPGSTPHILDDSGSPTFPPATVLRDNAAPLSAPPADTPHVSSSFVSAPLSVDENLVDVPLINKNMSVSTSFHPAHQTAMGNPRSLGTSSALVVAGTTQNIETFPRTSHLFTPDPSAFNPSKSMKSTPPTDSDTVAVRYTTDTHAPFDGLDIPSLLSPTLGLDGVLSTESRSSILAPVAPGTFRPWLLSAPDLGPAAQGEGSAAAKVTLGKEKDAPYRSSTICEDIMTNADLPLRSLSPTPMATICVDESFTHAPPLDNYISVPIPLQTVEQTTTESRRIPAPLPNPVNTRAIRRSNDASTRTVLFSTKKPSAFAPSPKSKASTSPPDSVAIEHPAEGCTPSLDDPPSPSPTQILTTESSSMLVPGAPITSPPPPSTPAPDLDTVPEDENGTGLCKDQDARHTSLAIREAITVVPDIPPQSPSPPSAAGVA